MRIVAVLLLAAVGAFAQNDEPLHEYAAKLVERLNVREMLPPKVQVTREAIRGGRILATAGFVIVPARLLIEAKSERELALAFAHALAHAPRDVHRGWIGCPGPAMIEKEADRIAEEVVRAADLPGAEAFAAMKARAGTK